MKDLQQHLLRDDQIVLGVRNEDPADLARKARLTASECTRDTVPENLISGITWEKSGSTEHRWAAPIAGQAPWVLLEWGKPVTVSEVQLTHDTGLRRILTMSAAENLQKQMITGPQPETARDYALFGVLPDGTEKKLADVVGNYQRLRRHSFEPVRLKGLRVEIRRSDGGEARLYEIRVYSEAPAARPKA